MIDSALTLPAAVLWDFDGTLADTEPVWIEAELALVERLGGTWTIEQGEQLVGSSLLDAAAHILHSIGRPELDPAWVVDELLRFLVSRIGNGPILWRPGALELLDSLHAAGIPCALVSASYRVLLDAALRQLPQGTFAYSIAGDEVHHGKPHPEPYLRAAAALGVRAADCLVIEDSENGARSGNAAGAVVLAVPGRVPVLPAPRRVILDSLVGLDATALATLGDPVRAAG